MLFRVFAITLLLWTTSANAWPVRGSGSSFNGGNAQLNFNFLAFGGEFPFLNNFKAAPNWADITTNLTIPPDKLNADGYPTVSGNAYSTVPVPPASTRSGNYVLAWDGNGTIYAASGPAVSYVVSAISFGGGSTQATLTLAAGPLAQNLAIDQTITISGVSGTGWSGINTSWQILAVNNAARTVQVNFNSSALSAPTLNGSSTLANSKTNPSTTSGGRYVFSGVGTGNVQRVGVQTNGTVPITNMRLLYDADEAAYNAGQVFQPIFLSWLRNGNIGVIRFLNYQLGNTSNVARWADRKPVSYFSYAADQMDPTKWVTSVSSAANGQDMTGTLASVGTGTPTDRTIIQLKAAGAAISAVNWSGGTVTITTASPHGLTVGASYLANISGLTPTAYNQNIIAITVIDASNFSYALASNPGAASGSGVFTALNTQSITLSSGIGSDLVATCASPCGLSNGDRVQISSTSSAPPTVNGFNLSQGSTLFVVSAAANTFKIASSAGGSALQLAASGSGSMSFTRMPTLTLNGGAATIGICASTGGALSSGFANNIRPATSVITLVYDAQFGCWIKGQVQNTSQGIVNAMPVEIMLEMAKQAGAHPYFVTPYLAADPISDWNSSLAAYIKANAPSWMIPRIEGPNELWNAAFVQTGYAYNRGDLYGWGHTQYNDWYGLVMSNIGQAWAGVYNVSNLGTTYHVLAGIQSVTAASGVPTSNAPRLTSAKYVAGSPSPPAGYTATAACNYVSAVAMAQYQTPTAYKTNSSALWAFNWFLSGYTDATQLANYVDTLLNTTASNQGGTLADLAVAWYPNARTWQQTYAPAGAACGGVGKVSYLMGYEGGFSYTGSIPTASSVTAGGGTNISSAVTAITNANPAQVTIGATTLPWTNGQSVTGTGNPPLAVGMYVCFTGLTGSYVAFNFATSAACYQIASVVDAVNGIFTISLDTSAATGSSTGTAFYAGDAAGTLANSSNSIYRAYMQGPTGVKAAAGMQGYTSGGSYSGGALHGNMDNFKAAGGTYPSQFQFGGTDNLWSVIDPDIFISQTPQPPIWLGIKNLN